VSSSQIAREGLTSNGTSAGFVIAEKIGQGVNLAGVEHGDISTM
jgi:hypothetical protein